MTDKPPSKPKVIARTHKGPPVHKADHAAFKRADSRVSKPMRIKR